MPLHLDEIEPGIVAYIDTSILLSDSRVTRPNDDQFKSRPFLCVVVGAGKTLWLNLTTQPGRYNHRFALRPEWRLHGSRMWRTHPSFVNNPGEPYIGRDVSFVDAARDEMEMPFKRPRVSSEGIAAIVAEMAARNNLLAP